MTYLKKAAEFLGLHFPAVKVIQSGWEITDIIPIQGQKVILQESQESVETT